MNRGSLRLALLLAFTALPAAARAETPALLQAAVNHWIAGKDDVAFTQRARTLDANGAVKEERLERYDPSLPDNQRWRLLEVNGQPPTDEQRKTIEQRKNRRPRKHANKQPAEFLDFPHAVVRATTPHGVTYEVALRPEAARLVQTEKLVLLITVGSADRRVERVTAALREPMRVALGLARITDVDFDLTFDPAPARPNDAPSDEAPSGTARVALSKFGERMQYEWWDFKRVNVYRAASNTPAPTGLEK